MKKILFVNTICSRGSTGRIVYDLYMRAKESGYSCAVAYGRGDAKGIPDSDTYKIGSTFSLYSSAFFSRLDDKEGFHLSHQTKRFLKFVESFEPDIIHLHNIHGYYLNCEILFAYLASHKEIKVVWTLHDMWAMTGHCAFEEGEPCEKWVSGCHSCPSLHLYPKSILLDSSKKNYQRKKKSFISVDNLTIVTPSNWLLSNVKKSYLKDEDSVCVNNGIDLDIFKPTESGLREKFGLENKKVILGVSFVWIKAKGFDDFIELRKLLDDNFAIVLIGVDEEKAKTLPDGIIPISRTESREELAAWYTAADYFVNLTYFDTFPTVNLESLACGTPVITYETGGSPEAADEESGAVFPKGNLHALAEFLKSEPLFLQEACLKRSKRFDKNNTLKGYIDIYDRS